MRKDENSGCLVCLMGTEKGFLRLLQNKHKLRGGMKMTKIYCHRCGIEIEPSKHGLKKYCDGCRTIAFKEEHARAMIAYEARKKETLQW